MSEDDRLGDSDRVAERADVVRAYVEVPLGWVAPSGSAVPAQVEVHDLSMLGESGEVGLEVRVVKAAGAAMDEDDRRQPPHVRAIGTSADPSTSNHSRVPLASAYITRSRHE